MRILITGSAGFIGFHVAHRLLADGHDVAGLDAFVPYYDVSLKERRHAILEQDARFVPHRVDLADAEAVRRAFAQARPEVVLHLAAQAGVRYAREHPETYVQSNMVGTFNLLEACRSGNGADSPVRHLLFASTSSVYGVNTKMPFVETDGTATPLTIYSASKRAGELMAHSYAHLWGLPVTAFRFFTVYGPWGRPDMALFKFTDAALRDEPIEVYNEGRMERDFTYIDDLVESIVRLIPAVPQPGVAAHPNDSVSPVAPFRAVNIGNGTPVPLLRFIAELERAVGRPIRRRLLPMQPGDIPKTWADTGLLEALTGYRPSTPVSEGIGRFVAWYREYYGMPETALPCAASVAVRQ